MNGMSYISLLHVGRVMMIEDVLVLVHTCTRCSNDAPAL